MKKILIRFLFFTLSSFVFLPQSFAAVWGEFSGYYNSDSFFAEENATNSQMFYSGDIFANLTNKYNWYAGFHFHQLSTTADVDGAEPGSFSTMDMGPMVMWVIDRKAIYTLSASYNLIAKATNDTGTAAEWEGTSFLVSFGVTPEIKEGWYVGFKMNYYSATYTKETISGNVEDVSNTRSMIFPSLVISYRK